MGVMARPQTASGREAVRRRAPQGPRRIPVGGRFPPGQLRGRRRGSVGQVAPGHGFCSGRHIFVPSPSLGLCLLPPCGGTACGLLPDPGASRTVRAPGSCCAGHAGPHPFLNSGHSRYPRRYHRGRNFYVHMMHPHALGRRAAAGILPGPRRRPQGSRRADKLWLGPQAVRGGAGEEADPSSSFLTKALTQSHKD